MNFHRFLKISWTYYGLLLRVVERIDGHYIGEEKYTIKPHDLRDLERDPEEFRAYLQVLEEDLNKRFDANILAV